MKAALDTMAAITDYLQQICFKENMSLGKLILWYSVFQYGSGTWLHYMMNW